MARTERRFESASVEATEALAERLGRALDRPCVLALDGELGSGKTAFVRGLARGLDVVDAVASPSFTLMHAYEGRLPLYHFDAWMEDREAAYLDDGGAAWLEGAGVAAIEWAGRLVAHLPPARLELRLEHVRGAPEARGLALAAAGDPGDPLYEALAGVVRALEAPEGISEGLSGEPGGPSAVGEGT